MNSLPLGSLALTLALVAGCAAHADTPGTPLTVESTTFALPDAAPDGGPERSCPHEAADGGVSGDCADPALSPASDAAACPEGFVCEAPVDAGYLEWADR